MDKVGDHYKDFRDKSSLLERSLNNPILKRYGFNVLFSGLDKAPKLPWERWQSQPQLDGDIRVYYNGMGATNVTCWGFITGFKGLVSLDFDWGWIYRLWKTKFGARAETLTVQTPNGGWILRVANLPIKNQSKSEFFGC